MTYEDFAYALDYADADNPLAVNDATAVVCRTADGKEFKIIGLSVGTSADGQPAVIIAVDGK